MTVKQWLSRARTCDREINVLEQTKTRERDRLLSITASMDGDVVNHTEDPHRFDKYIELVDALDRRIDELYGIKNEVRQLIEQVQDARLRELLMLRYVSIMTWEQIAVTMSYSYMHVCRLHGDALIAADEIYKKM